MVFSPMGVVAYHVAESLGIPSAWGALQPLTRTTAWPSLLVSPARDLGWANRYTYTVAERLQWWLFGTSVDSYRRGAGLKPHGRRGPFREIEQSCRCCAAGHPPYCRRPGLVVAVSVTGRWHLPSDGRLPTELDNFLDAGPPPVYIGLGSMTVQSPDVTTRMLVSAARELGARIVLSRGWTGLGGGLRTGRTSASSTKYRMTPCSGGAPRSSTTRVQERRNPSRPPECPACRCLSSGISHSGPASPLNGNRLGPGAQTPMVDGPIAASLAQALLEPWRAERAGR